MQTREIDNLLNKNNKIQYGATDIIIDMQEAPHATFNDLPNEVIQLIIEATPVADIITSFQFVESRIHHLSLRDKRNKLSFFRKEQDRINDEIEVINHGQSTCKSIASVIGTGAGATILSSLYAHHVATKDHSDPLEKLAAAFLVLASVGLIVWGIVKIIMNRRIDNQTDKLLDQIEVINKKMSDERQKNKASGPKI